MSTKHVICINNEGYPVSLVMNAIYETLPDDEAAKHKLIRVIDESGEDYLYPESCFVSMPPQTLKSTPIRISED